MKMILGTASQYRKQVFEEMGYTDFEVMAADIDEKAIRFDDPEKLTLALANAKADVLVKRIHESALLITADQVVAWNGEIREKPGNEEQAREYLRTYHKAPARVMNGLTVTNTGTGKRVSGVDSTTIVFKEISEEVIGRLIANGDIFNRAGGFSITDPLLKPYLESIEGTLDSAMGLPKLLTQQLIKEAQSPW